MPTLKAIELSGKTGTAQKVAESGGYMKDKYIVSSMGMAPTNDPRLVCLVVIDEPQEANAGGGVTAAPIFKAVMEDSLRYLGVVSQQAHVEGEGADDEAASKYVAVPECNELNARGSNESFAYCRFKRRSCRRGNGGDFSNASCL